MVFAVKDSPVYLAGAFDLSAAMVEGEPKVEAAFRTGAGVRWGESRLPVLRRRRVLPARAMSTPSSRAGCRRSRAYAANCKAGAKVADIGCGVGFSTLLMAEAFPKSWFVGYRLPCALDRRRRSAHARAHGVADRVRFEVAAAKDITERDFDLVTMFDCLHDMGDPRGCAAHMRALLKPDAAWMIVEPIAGDAPGDNVGNPVGRLYYNASTMICVPTSLAPGSRRSLGAQAGEAKLPRCLASAGFAPRAPRHRRPLQHGAGSPRLGALRFS